MTIPELIANARECAKDALVALDAAERYTDPRLKREALCTAAALLGTGREEADRAHKDLHNAK